MEEKFTQDELMQNFILELKRGVSTLAVLKLCKTARYGYSLVQSLGQSGVIVEANTLYPLLRRLEKQGLLSSEWDTTEVRPRKFYILTEFGINIYKTLKTEWLKITNQMQILSLEE